MKIIYKYELKVESIQTVTMQIGAKILSVVEQHGQIVLYALVDRRVKGIEDVGIVILGTGHEVTDETLDGFKFIDTVKLDNGDSIFHVFYRQSDI